MSRFDLIGNIEKYGLTLGSRRELRLFTLSCVALGYCKFLREIAGFTYEAHGVLGREDGYVSFVNEEDVVEKTKRLLQNKTDFLAALEKSKNIFAQCERDVKKAEKQLEKNPYDFLASIVGVYPMYFSALGFYNCLWRLSKTDSVGDFFSNETLEKIGKERNEIGGLYPKVEITLKAAFGRIARDLDVDKELLFFLTHAEMQTLVNDRSLDSGLKGELKLRQKGYFELRISKGDKEYVLTDEKLLKDVESKFLNVPTNTVSVIRGQVAYPGLVKGIVNNVDIFSNPKHLKGGVLVAFHTHPQFVPIIKESAAIVCDEGGLLCHAAIISRELKIPCIVGTKNGTKVLKDGDFVEVDAHNGIVRILKS